MATITRVSRQSGYACKAPARHQTFSKTFKRRADAKTWAERMERNIDQARAHGNAILQ